MNDRVHQAVPRAAGHALGELLVIKRAKRLSSTPAVEKIALKRTLAHLLQERSKECLADPCLSLLDELLMSTEGRVTRMRGMKHRRRMRLGFRRQRFFQAGYSHGILSLH